MKYFLLFFLSFSLFLFAHPKIPEVVAATESEPTSLVSNFVNVITGDAILYEEDMRIEGREPLSITRFYLSGDGQGEYGGWEFYPHLKLYLHKKKKSSYPVIQVSDPNGTTLTYEKPKHGIWCPILGDKALGLTNTAHGFISGKNNLQNNRINLNSNGKNNLPEAYLTTGDGTLRYYTKLEDKKDLPLFLEWEKLPNGNFIRYKYEKLQGSYRLVKISTHSPNNNIEYAFATFTYRFEETKQFLEIQSCDGRKIDYEFVKTRNDDTSFLLHKIKGATALEQSLFYQKKNEAAHPKVARYLSFGKRPIILSYYAAGFFDPNNMPFGTIPKNDLRCDRVWHVKSPVKKDDQYPILYEFEYDLGRYKKGKKVNKAGCTTVIGPKKSIEKFHFSSDLRLTSIERKEWKDQEHHLHSNLKFIWGENGELLHKWLEDEDGKYLFGRSFSYDDRYNVIEEEHFGSITSPLNITYTTQDFSKIYTQLEKSKVTYSYSGDVYNLLLEEVHPSGKRIIYQYLKETNLPTAIYTYDKQIICKRHFFEYNSNKILVKEISDDGSSLKKNNLTSVRERKIQNIIPDEKTGLTIEISENYLDLETKTEKLLKRTYIHYSKERWPVQQDVYDANDCFAYSLKKSYDSHGRIIKETNSLGQEARYSYDDRGNKIVEEDFSSSITTYNKYDAANNLISSKITTLDQTRTVSHKYDLNRKKIESTDHMGRKSYFVYNINNNVTKIIHPGNSDQYPVETRDYNALGHLTSSTSPNGYQTKKTYNAYGQPFSISYPDGSKEFYKYTLDGHLKESTDTNGLTTKYTIDTLGRVVKKSYFDKKKRLLSEEHFTYSGLRLIEHADQEGIITLYSYDDAGRKTEEVRGDRTTHFSYDSLGHVETQTDGDLCERYQYDLLDRIVEKRVESKNTLYQIVSYTYDSLGNQTSITTKNDKESHTQTFCYDGFSRLIEITTSDGTTTIDYDESNKNQYNQHYLKKTTTDPLNQKTVETYDILDRLILKKIISSEDQLLSKEEFIYDLEGNLVKQISSLDEKIITTCWEYNKSGQLAAIHEAYGSPDQKTTRYSYSKNNASLENLYKPDGLHLRHSYDIYGNLKELTSSKGDINYSYEYDKLGRLIKVSDKTAGKSCNYTYNQFGDPLSETLFTGFTFHKSYDNQGRKTELILPDNSSITYQYDPLSLKKVSRYKDDTLLYTHTYDEDNLFGDPLSETFIKDLGSIEKTYDKEGRLSSIKTAFTSYNISNRDAVGNILEIDTLKERKIYSYDGLYQLIKDELHTYQFDAHNTRTSKDNTSYTTNSLHQILVEKSFYQYDRNGNRISKDNIEYSYDSLNRLITVISPNSIIEFTYDHKNRRLSKKVSTQNEEKSIYYLYDGNLEIGSYSNNKIQELRILGRNTHAEIGSTVALELDDKVYAPCHDLQGNITALIDPSTKTIVEEYDYTPFGEEIKKADTYKNPWRYCSKRIDEETGLINFGHRYYDPHLGSWLTPDPFHFIDGLNLYAYVYNNPLLYKDPYGEFVFVIPIIYAGVTLTNVLMATAIAATAAAVCYEAQVYLSQPHYNKKPTFYREYENDWELEYRPDRWKVLHKTKTPIGPDVEENENKDKQTAALDEPSSKKKDNLPQGHIWEKNSPFKDKTADDLHEMFDKKEGIEPYGPNPKNGLGSYVNEKKGRQYYIDRKDKGRYNEPSHVDVSRPENYRGPLKKKRFIYYDE